MLFIIRKIIDLTYGQRVEDCPHHRKEQNCPEMIEKQPVGHEVPRVQNNGREHVEKERVGGEGVNVEVGGEEEKEANDHAHHYEEAGLGEYLVEPRCHVEAWN